MCKSVVLFPDQDGAEPSPNSVAASNLLRLSNLLDKQYQPGARDVFSTFREQMIEHPIALPQMLAAFMESSRAPKQASKRPYYLYCCS